MIISISLILSDETLECMTENDTDYRSDQIRNVKKKTLLEWNSFNALVIRVIKQINSGSICFILKKPQF